jgi:hypothetical protein
LCTGGFKFIKPTLLAIGTVACSVSCAPALVFSAPSQFVLSQHSVLFNTRCPGFHSRRSLSHTYVLLLVHFRSLLLFFYSSSPPHRPALQPFAGCSTHRKVHRQLPTNTSSERPNECSYRCCPAYGHLITTCFPSSWSIPSPTELLSNLFIRPTTNPQLPSPTTPLALTSLHPNQQWSTLSFLEATSVRVPLLVEATLSPNEDLPSSGLIPPHDPALHSSIASSVLRGIFHLASSHPHPSSILTLSAHV